MRHPMLVHISVPVTLSPADVDTVFRQRLGEIIGAHVLVADGQLKEVKEVLWPDRRMEHCEPSATADERRVLIAAIELRTALTRVMGIAQ